MTEDEIDKLTARLSENLSSIGPELTEIVLFRNELRAFPRGLRLYFSENFKALEQLLDEPVLINQLLAVTLESAARIQLGWKGREHYAEVDRLISGYHIPLPTDAVEARRYAQVSPTEFFHWTAIPLHSSADGNPLRLKEIIQRLDINEANPSLFLDEMFEDITVAKRGYSINQQQLWNDKNNSEPYLSMWDDVKIMAAASPEAWSFWIDWYDRILFGKKPRKKLIELVLGPKFKFWNFGGDFVNQQLDRVFYDFEAEPLDHGATLAVASAVDFSFRSLYDWVQAVGFKDDIAHLKDEGVVRAFLDDINEARDGLVDFADYASDLGGASNSPRILQRAAEKLLEELKLAKDLQHVRARRIVSLGKHLESFSNEEGHREALGETLAEMLDQTVDLTKKVCRQHFAPSILIMDFLNRLDLDGIEPSDLLNKLDAAISSVESADGSNLVQLRPDDLVMLKSMASDLREIEASISEGTSEQFIEGQRKKLARGAGELTATIGKYVEVASVNSADAGKKFDSAVKWYKRIRTMGDVYEWLEAWLQGGTPPGA